LMKSKRNWPALIFCSLLISGFFSAYALGAEKGWLGVAVQQVTGRDMRTIHMQYGRWQVIFVSQVFKGSPAEQMGIQANDVILSVNYRDVNSPGQFTEAVSRLSPGDKIVLLVARSKEKAQYLSGVIGKAPAAAPTGAAPESGARPAGRGGRAAFGPPSTTAPPVPTAPLPSADGPAMVFAPTGISRIITVAWSPDGRYLLSGGDAFNSLKLWDVSTGREVRTFVGHTEPRIQTVAFSPDSRYALSGGFDKTVRLWEVATGRELKTFTGHSMLILSVAFAPDGRYAASGSRDAQIKLWDVASGKEVRTFSGVFAGHADGVKSIAFSPDGKHLLSGSFDNTLKLWEAATGNHIRTFSGHAWQVQSVAFSPDGKRAFSRSGKRKKKRKPPATNWPARWSFPALFPRTAGGCSRPTGQATSTFGTWRRENHSRPSGATRDTSRTGSFPWT